MLPDYPKVKSHLSQRLNSFVQERIDFHLGPLRTVARIRLFEGSTRSMTRESGEVDPGRTFEARAELALGKDELPMITLQDVLAKLDRGAQEMARQMAENTYQTISDAVEKVGNVTDAGGRRLTAEVILDALSSIHIEFRPDGTARMPEMHIHPSLAEAAKLAIAELEGNADLRRQFQQIIEDRREVWRAREASRKLVG
jgi:hypothetical protein